MFNYLLGDLLTRLNQAKTMHYRSIDVPNTKLNLKILRVLLSNGVLRQIKFENEFIKVFPKYKNRLCVYSRMTLVSKPSKRIYYDWLDLKKFKNKTDKLNIFILSTPQGIMDDFECFLNKSYGEVLFKIKLR